MRGLSSSATADCHQVNRATLYADLLHLYITYPGLTDQYPLEMKFVNEQAVDLGGVSRDVMPAFWQDAYEKMFEGSKLIVPVMNPHTDVAMLTRLGTILSHGYLCTGFLPTRISFPSLVAIVLGPGAHIEDVESFLDYVSDVDRNVLSSAVEILKHSSKTSFPSDVQEQLLTVLSNYGFRQIPSPSTLSQIVSETARFVFLSSPMSASCTIHSGIPFNHKALAA